MNKAKFLLAGIGVLAAAASAIAAKIETKVFVRPETTTLCELTLNNATTVFTLAAQTTTLIYATTKQGDPCPEPITVYTGVN